MNFLPWLIPVAPLIAAVLCTLLSLGGRGRNNAHWFAWAGLLTAAVISIRMLYSMDGADSIEVVNGYHWMDIGRIQIPIALRFDAIGLVQICVVTCVSFLVVVYSAGYMHGDPGYARFFAVFSAFVFSMSMLALASNLLVLYAFWEGVGLCSYLLIGYWFQRPSAAKAATKAFLVNRIADCGFLIGILTLWYAVGLTSVKPESFFGRLDFDVIFAAVPELVVSQPGMLSFIGFMMLMGAVGKSAQFPLHVWLPDAMEGPTPVSALIHAATMVTAGVYLMARMSPLLQETPEVLIVAGHLGAATALLAALIALFQDDLKRVLAYSTVSQLGYMFMGIGSGAGHGMITSCRGRRYVPFANTRILQSTSIPIGWQCDACHGRCDRHEGVQWAPKSVALHALVVPHRCVGTGWCSTACWILEQGRDLGKHCGSDFRYQSRRGFHSLVGCWSDHSVIDFGLHLPSLLPNILG